MNYSFRARIDIIGINPYVPVPEDVLSGLLLDSGREKGPIQVKGTINDKPFMQTVVKYQGVWRLYLNTPMRTASVTVVGDTADFIIEYDPKSRNVPPPKALLNRLDKDAAAKKAFESLPPYRQKEISRYLTNLKSEEKREENIDKVMRHLQGKKVDSILFYDRTTKKSSS